VLVNCFTNYERNNDDLDNVQFKIMTQEVRIFNERLLRALPHLLAIENENDDGFQDVPPVHEREIAIKRQLLNIRNNVINYNNNNNNNKNNNNNNNDNNNDNGR
jgi:hypothetical protein